MKRHHKIIAAAVLGIAIFLSYSNSMSNGFLRDDKAHITENLFIRDLSNVKYLVSKEYFVRTRSISWRPLVTTLRMAQYKLFGLDPAAWRLTSLTAHVINSGLLLLVLESISSSFPLAFAAAAVFALHPVHTETINYVADGQSDIFCLFFMLLSFAGYLRGRHVSALFSFLAALLFKEMALAYPFFLLAYDRLFQMRPHARRWLPYLAAALCMLALRLIVFKPMPGFLDNAEITQGIQWYRDDVHVLLAVPEIFYHYLRILFLPLKLSLQLDRVVIPKFPLDWTFYPLLALLASAAAGALYAFIKRKRLGFPLVIFMVFFIPISNLIPLASPAQEHFLYSPSVAFCLAAAWLLDRLYERGGSRKTVSAALFLALAVGYALRVHARNADWKDGVSIVTADLTCFPDSAPVNFLSAVAYDSASRDSEAIALLKKSIFLDPGYVNSYIWLSRIYMRMGVPAQAQAISEEALRAKPDSLIAVLNAAGIGIETGELDRAETLSCRALKMAPDSYFVYAEIGGLYEAKKDYAMAEACLERAMAINPYAKLIPHLTRVYGILGKNDKIAGMARMTPVDWQALPPGACAAPIMDCTAEGMW